MPKANKNPILNERLRIAQNLLNLALPNHEPPMFRMGGIDMVIPAWILR